MPSLNRLPCYLLLFLALAACSPSNEVSNPALTLEPVATLPPTMGPLATGTLAPTHTVPLPSATPDPNVVPEQFVSPRGVLAFRYPSGWSVTDNSDSSELLVRVQSPSEGGASGLFIVNLLNVQGPLAREELRPLAESYLQDLFGEAYPGLTVSYREEGEALIATTFQEMNGEQVQYEIRFSSRAPFYLVMLLVAAQQEWDAAAPTLDTMARSVTLDPALAGAVPTPTVAVTRTGEGLSVQNATLYEAGTGSLYLVGEVINESGQPYEDVQVTISILNEAGEEVGREQWAVQRKLLPPGERSPLLAIFSQPPPGWSSFQATAEALPASFYPERVTTSFQLSDVVASEPAFGDYALAGQVANTGEAARFVEITGTLYDEAGRVLAVETTTLEQDELPAGESAPFMLTFYSKAEGEVARHEISVEGTRIQN
ncbi:MAG TPA: FxLYD domain-containing protein [Ardenticatenaceae bacterium]